MALGATQGRVIGRVVGDALRLVGIGAIIGVPAAFVAGRSIEALLFGVRGTDALTISGAALLLVAVAVGTSLRPAFRASRVNPTVVLRSE
jgi:putative ABC transport system permease protein